MMFVMGIDIGYSNLKIAGSEVGTKAVRTRVLPSGAGPVSDLPMRLGKHQDDRDAIVVDIDGEPWVAGVDQSRLETTVRDLHADFPATSAYRALFLAALLTSERTSVGRVVTGLPVSQFLDANAREKLRGRLTGDHQVSTKRSVKVVETVVVPQPFGAYLDLVSTHPDVESLTDARIVVLDPGFYSVDWIAIENGELRKSNSGTSRRAMSMLIETANTLIQEDHGGGAGVSRLERAVREGKTTSPVFGQPVELAPYLERAGGAVAHEALKEMRQNFRNDERAVDLVLIVGGGAGAYRTAAEELFPKTEVIIPTNPVLANARGFLAAALNNE